MSEFISGKEALIALANGDEVENWNGNVWWSVESNWQIGAFTKTDRKFRIKPRTITINGVEVPACGINYKPHTFMFVLNSLEPCGYSKIILDESDEIPPYWWQTEDEIKQVVAALPSIFNVK